MEYIEKKVTMREDGTRLRESRIQYREKPDLKGNV